MHMDAGETFPSADCATVPEGMLAQRLVCITDLPLTLHFFQGSRGRFPDRMASSLKGAIVTGHFCPIAGRRAMKLRRPRPSDMITWRRASPRSTKKAREHSLKDVLSQAHLQRELSLRLKPPVSHGDVHVVVRPPPLPGYPAARRSKTVHGTPGIRLLTSGLNVSATGHSLTQSYSS